MSPQQTIHETIKQGHQSHQDISWQFYEPVGAVLALRHNQMRYSPRRPISRVTSNDANMSEQPISESANEASPASSPRLDEEMNSKLLEPVVTISLANKMLQQTSHRVTRGVYVKGQYAKLDSFGDESDSQADEIKYAPAKKPKMEISHDRMIKHESNSRMTALLNYEQKRDRVLFEQNNNMLKMMKALLEKQGVPVPFEVSVNYSHI